MVSMRGAWTEKSGCADQSLVHLAEDMQTARFRLLEGFFHDLWRDACDLDVHLQAT